MRKTLAIVALVFAASTARADTYTSRLGNLILPTLGSANWGVKVSSNFINISTEAASQYDPNTFLSSNTFLNALLATNVGFTFTGPNGNVVSASSGSFSGVFGDASHMTGVVSAIAAGSLDTTKLAADAVTTAKILDANVTTAKLANSAVDTTKLASDAVTTTKILDLAVTAKKIAAASIDTSKLNITIGRSNYSPAIALVYCDDNGAGSCGGLVGWQGDSVSTAANSPNSIVQRTGQGWVDATAFPNTVTFNSTETILGNALSVGGSTFTVIGGTTTADRLNIGTVLDLKTNKINNVGDPASAQDAATKNYVDITVPITIPDKITRLATAAALPTNVYANGSSGVGATLTGTGLGALTVDGVATAVGDRITVKNEADTTHNGIYSVTTTAGGAFYVLTRSADFNQPSEMIGGTLVVVDSGTVNNDALFVLIATITTIGTDPILFAQVNGTNQITAGYGLLKAGNTISIDTTAVLAANATGFNMIGPAFSVGTSTFVVAGSSIGIRAATPLYAFHNAGDSYVKGLEIVGGTMTVQGNAFSVGGASLSVSGGYLWSGATITLGIGASSVTSQGIVGVSTGYVQGSQTYTLQGGVAMEVVGPSSATWFETGHTPQSGCSQGSGFMESNTGTKRGMQFDSSNSDALILCNGGTLAEANGSTSLNIGGLSTGHLALATAVMSLTAPGVYYMGDTKSGYSVTTGTSAIIVNVNGTATSVAKFYNGGIDFLQQFNIPSSSLTIGGNAFSVGATTLSITSGMVGIGTAAYVGPDGIGTSRLSPVFYSSGMAVVQSTSPNATSTVFAVVNQSGSRTFYVRQDGAAQLSSTFFVPTLSNSTSGNNAQIQLNATGTVNSRNVADSGHVLVVQQSNASATGDILVLKASASTATIIDLSGNAIFSGTFTVQGNALSVGGSTFAVSAGSVGIGVVPPVASTSTLLDAGTLSVTGNAQIGTLQLNNIASGTQCLQADGSGNITGSGGSCGAAAGTAALTSTQTFSGGNLFTSSATAGPAQGVWHSTNVLSDFTGGSFVNGLTVIASTQLVSAAFGEFYGLINNKTYMVFCDVLQNTSDATYSLLFNDDSGANYAYIEKQKSVGAAEATVESAGGASSLPFCASSDLNRSASHASWSFIVALNSTSSAAVRQISCDYVGRGAFPSTQSGTGEGANFASNTVTSLRIRASAGTMTGQCYLAVLNYSTP